MKLCVVFFACLLAFGDFLGDEITYEYIIRENASNYFEARTGCTSINASLVSIKNEAQIQPVIWQVQKYEGIISV